MHGILDDLLVGLVLLASMVYAVFSLGPRTLRQRVMQGAGAALRRLPSVLHARGIALRLEAASMKSTGACGGCDNCGSAQSSKAPPPGGSAAAEVSIPLSKIGRR